MAAPASAAELMAGTTAPFPSQSRKKRMVAGEVQTSFVFPRCIFPASSAEAERQTQTCSSPERLSGQYREPGLVGLPRGPGGAAIQHEPDSVPAARPVAGEMQRLRGEVRSAFPGDRGWRLGSGQGGKMAAPASGHRPAAGCRAGVLTMRRGTQLGGPPRNLAHRVGRC